VFAIIEYKQNMLRADSASDGLRRNLAAELQADAILTDRSTEVIPLGDETLGGDVAPFADLESS